MESNAIKVILDPEEEILAARHAEQVNEEALRHQRSPANGLKRGKNPLTPNIIGSRGQLAFSKTVGIPLEVRTCFRGPNVGSLYKVRSRGRNYFDLIFRENDDPNLVFVLATSSGPGKHIYLWGWLWGRQCMERGTLKRMEIGRCRGL